MSMTSRLSLRALLLLAALVVALPAAAQVGARAPGAPLYDAIRSAGASAADAARLADAVTEEAKLTASDGEASHYFGGSVALHGDLALVGASRADESRGAVYVFVRSGTTWAQEAKLTASDGAEDDSFGGSVALDGERALIGASGDDNRRGAAYVFVRSGTTWTEEAKLTASDGEPWNSFGGAVALDGERALVGARNANESYGAAYVFVRSGSTWTEEAKLTPSDINDEEEGGNFGQSLALDGERALVGADATDEYRGVAYVFVRSGSTWTEEAKLTASDGEPDDGLGGAVSLDGDRALVSAYGVDSYRGAAYVFVRSGSTWAEEAKLTASDGEAWDTFGGSVSLDGARALVGSYYTDDSRGAAYVFVRSGSTWTEAVKLTASDGAPYDFLGYSLALDGDRVLVGAQGDDTYRGAAYSYTLEPVVTGAFAFLRPTAGDRYRVGSYLKAIWDSPAPAPANVVLSLRKGIGPATEIYRGPNLVRPDFGAARYLIPDGTPAGHDYTLRIESADDASAFAVSDPFSIINRTTFTVDPPGSGEVLALGSTRTVTWTSPAGAASGTVTLALFYKANNGLVSSVSTANDGEAPFTFPADPAGPYYFTITSDDNPLYSARSANVKLGYVGVLSPTAGMTYAEGDPMTIAWESPTVTDPGATAQILLKRAGERAVVLAASTENDGTFETTVPAGLTSASDYFVIVRVSSSPFTYVSKSGQFAIHGTAAPRVASPTTHFALSPLTYGSREATVRVWASPTAPRSAPSGTVGSSGPPSRAAA